MNFPIGFFKSRVSDPNISIAGTPSFGSKIATATTTAAGSTLYADAGLPSPTTSRSSPFSISVAAGSTLYAQSRRGSIRSNVVSITNENDPGGGL